MAARRWNTSRLRSSAADHRPWQRCQALDSEGSGLLCAAPLEEDACRRTVAMARGDLAVCHQRVYLITLWIFIACLLAPITTQGAQRPSLVSRAPAPGGYSRNCRVQTPLPTSSVACPASVCARTCQFQSYRAIEVIFMRELRQCIHQFENISHP